MSPQSPSRASKAEPAGSTTDPPRGEEYWTAASDDFQHATDLVRYIRKQYGQDFCIGVAGACRLPFVFPLFLATDTLSL